MIVNEWEAGCPLLLTQRIILGKWKLSIIWFLAHNKKMRFSELKRAFDDSKLSQKCLLSISESLKRTILFQGRYLMKFQQKLNIPSLKLAKNLFL